MCFRWNTSINFLFWGFETTPSWSHFKVLLCKLIWDGYTHRFLLPLFLLFFLPSLIFEVVSFFLILPVLLSPLQLVIYSVWWCCLFRVFMLVFHADVYRVYCRIYYVVLNPSKSVELYIRLLTMMRNSGMCTFPISAFQKKKIIKVLPPFVVCWWPLYYCFLLSSEGFAAILPRFENLAPPPCLS